MQRSIRFTFLPRLSITAVPWQRNGTIPGASPCAAQLHLNLLGFCLQLETLIRGLEVGLARPATPAPGICFLTAALVVFTAFFFALLAAVAASPIATGPSAVSTANAESKTAEPDASGPSRHRR